MKVTFIYPSFENLGIEYLSAALKQAGHSTELVFDPRLFDDNILMNAPLAKVFSYKKKVLQRVRDSKPDLVAMSLISPNYLWGIDLAHAIKEIMAVPIVCGGMHISAVPDIAIRNPDIDYLIVGEGELPLVELAEALESGVTEPDIQNLWYKRDGRIVAREVRPPIQDLDILPFPDKDMYQRNSSLFKIGYTALSGRGCTSRCTFCHHSFYGKLYDNKGPYLRKRSVTNLVEELREAKHGRGVKFIRFYDDNFTYNREWMVEFAQTYTRDVHLPFYCMGNPETITEEVAECLEAAGCYELQVGVQTINDRTRNEILNRRETTPEVIRAITAMKKTKVRIVTDNLIDIPGQDESEVLELARFYNEHRVDRINIYWTTYFARIGLVDIARKKGLISDGAIRRIEEAPSSRATYIGQAESNKELRKYQLLLALLLFLPRKWVDFIIQKDLYRFFPRIPPFFVTTLVSSLRSKQKYHFFEKRAMRRYLEFGIRRFLP